MRWGTQINYTFGKLVTVSEELEENGDKQHF